MRSGVVRTARLLCNERTDTLAISALPSTLPRKTKRPFASPSSSQSLSWDSSKLSIGTICRILILTHWLYLNHTKPINYHQKAKSIFRALSQLLICSCSLVCRPRHRPQDYAAVQLPCSSYCCSFHVLTFPAKFRPLLNFRLGVMSVSGLEE